MAGTEGTSCAPSQKERRVVGRSGQTLDESCLMRLRAESHQRLLLLLSL